MASKTIASRTHDDMLEALRLALPERPNALDRHRFAIEWICRRLDEQGSEIDRLKDPR